MHALKSTYLGIYLLTIIIYLPTMYLLSTEISKLIKTDVAAYIIQ